MNCISFENAFKRTTLALIALLFAISSNAQSDSKEEKVKGQNFYPNIISAGYQSTDAGEGFGIQYEHFLNEKASLYLPVAVSFLKDNSHPSLNGSYTYLYPGVKFYPWGSQHLFSYSVGPSLALGFGEEIRYPDEPWADPFVSAAQGTQLGIMVNNGLNIRPGRFYIGTELGFGLSFCNATNPVFGNSGLLLQFQCKAGYCF